MQSPSLARRPRLTRKDLFRLHRWMGLNLGLLLFIVCFSGTCATLGDEWDQLLGIAPAPASCPDEIDWAAVERQALSQLGHVSHLMASDGCGPIRALHHPGGGRIQRVAIDPGTGEILDQGSTTTIQAFLRQFHKALLLPNGLYLVTLMALVLGYSIVSGLLVYRRWWSHLRRLRWARGPRVLWSDIHRTLGIWTAFFGLLMVVTGLWYLFEAGAREATGFVAEPPIPEMARDRLRALPPQPERLPLAELASAARLAIPGLDVRAMHFPIHLGDAVQVDGQSGAWLVRDRANRVYLDPYDGTVLGYKHVDELSPLERWADTADVLHFGSFAGVPSKIIWFVLGVLLSLVCLAGPVMWHLRVNRPDPDGHARPRHIGRTRGLLPYVPVLVLLLVSAALSVRSQRSSGRPTPPITYHSAPTPVGPWSVMANFRSGPDASHGVYRILAAGPGDPTWTAASIELAGDAEPRAMRVSLRGVVLSAPATETLTLRLVDPAGATHQARLTLEPVAPAAMASNAPTKVPAHVTTFVASFMVLQILCVIVWGVIIRRRSAGRPVQRETPGPVRADYIPVPKRNTP